MKRILQKSNVALSKNGSYSSLKSASQKSGLAKTSFVDFSRQRKRPEFKKYANKTDYTQNIGYHQDPCNQKNWLNNNNNFKFSKQLGIHHEKKAAQNTLLYKKSQLGKPKKDINLAKILNTYKQHDIETMQNKNM